MNSGATAIVSSHFLRGSVRVVGFSNDGTVAVASGGDFTVAGTESVTSADRFEIAGHTSVERGGDFVNLGRTLVLSGALLENYGVFDHRENAVLAGSGTFDTSSGTAFVKGIVEPGGSVGVLDFVGDFVQTGTSEIRVEIGGHAPASGYDQLRIAGETSLDGAVELSFLPGFVPEEGESFDVIVLTTPLTQGRSFSFDCFSGLDVSDTLYMEPVERPTRFMFLAVAGSSGNSAPLAAADYDSIYGYAPVVLPVLANDSEPRLGRPPDRRGSHGFHGRRGTGRRG